MQYSRVLKDLAEKLENGKLAFVAGSGIGRLEPSNLPTGENLRAILAEAFLSSLEPEMQKRMLERIMGGVPPARNPIGFEEVCQAVNQAVRLVQPDDKDDVISILKVVLDGTKDRPTQPNAIHRFLA